MVSMVDWTQRMMKLLRIQVRIEEVGLGVTVTGRDVKLALQVVPSEKEEGKWNVGWTVKGWTNWKEDMPMKTAVEFLFQTASELVMYEAMHQYDWKDVIAERKAKTREEWEQEVERLVDSFPPQFSQRKRDAIVARVWKNWEVLQD